MRAVSSVTPSPLAPRVRRLTQVAIGGRPRIAFGVDGGGNIPELIVDQRQSGFILPDRRLPLAVESRVDQGELPCGRCLAREDAISAAYTHLRAHETGRNLVCRLLL